MQNIVFIAFVWLILFIAVSRVHSQCKELPSVEHSTNNATGLGPYPNGTVVEVRCNQGYYPEGNIYFTCDGNAFQGSLVCNIITCPIVDPPRNGKLANNPSYEVGKSITFECDEGYDLKGQATLNCRIDGEWSPDYVPTCTAKNCGEFGPVTDGTTFQETTTEKPNDYGSVVRVTCNSGYTLNGDKYVKCKSDGTWEPKPMCVKVECPHFQGSDSNCVKQQMLVGDTLYMICKDDVSVTHIGDVSVTCKNGQWSSLDMACYCDCEVTVDPASMTVSSNLVTLNEKQYVKHNTELNWNCKAGYVKNTIDSLKCIDGNITKPICNVQVTEKPKRDEANQDTSPHSTEGHGGKPLSKGPGTLIIVVAILIPVLVISGITIAIVLYLKKKHKACFV